MSSLPADGVASAAMSREMLPKQQPLEIPGFFSQRLCGLALVMTCVVLSVLGFLAFAKCGLCSIRVGEHLHLLSDPEQLAATQSAWHLPCSDACRSAAGQDVVVVSIDVRRSSLDVRLSSGTTLTLAPTAVREVVCSDTWAVTGLVVACIGASMSVVVIAVFAVMWCQMGHHHKLLRERIEQGSAQVYRMVLSGDAAWHFANMVYGPGGHRRKQACQGFPCLELGVLLPLMLTLMVQAQLAVALAGLGVAAFLVSIRLGLLLHSVLMSRARLYKRTTDIAFCTLPEDRKICVIYNGSMLLFRNIGDIPAQGPINAQGPMDAPSLAQTQLVARHEVPEDDGTPITGWSLRICYLTWNKDQGWTPRERFFPVDPARLHDFHRWLMEDEQQRLFRFAGAALSTSQMPATTRRALAGPSQRQTEEDLPRMLMQTQVLAIHTDDGRDLRLLSLAGEEVARVLVHDAELVADVLHRVCVRPEFGGSEVKIVLPGGQTLDRIDPKLTIQQIRPLLLNVSSELA
ncbi:unnamed protein product [Symbiodinium natans]|uniref:Uncharacterized protein n=1 Tax=Symbiodinium natans TaxID=878477 RepID=A0A812N404_9DINO|nr:unnamed protein product [Symbiodinium natans]